MWGFLVIFNVTYRKKYMGLPSHHIPSKCRDVSRHKYMGKEVGVPYGGWECGLGQILRAPFSGYMTQKKLLNSSEPLSFLICEVR